MQLKRELRDYQKEADVAVYNELFVRNKDKCIVKMFCGTGKSVLMRQCKAAQNHKLVVYVFPSLQLVKQFREKEFTKEEVIDFENIICISSELGSTTDPYIIKTFLSNTCKKIICITYQSFETLLDCLGETKINVCIFDEAHHAVGETYQKLIFDNNICEKQIFLTATPKNANGIIMHDENNPQLSMCGNLVYDYSYFRGMTKGHLNPFEIRVDMYTENANKSVYECIARAILESGNTRVLTFHSDVNTDRDTSVKNFVDEKLFINTFKSVLKNEFPKMKLSKFKRIQMIELHSGINSTKRDEILKQFDTTNDSEIIVISSCETIGEGTDTKNANMCVFVDPKTSFVKIVQNIGRIVRPQSKISTILIPCWVNREKYLGCNGDKEKCDEVIRQDMAEGGNFNGILNVMSALKQEDPEIYDICLHYPHQYSPKEIEANLEKQGCVIGEVGKLIDVLCDLLDIELDYEEYEEYEDCDNDEDIIMRIAKDNDVRIEVHTNSLENPVSLYNPGATNVVRLYKDEETQYFPIIHAETGEKKRNDHIEPPCRENRLKFNVHTNPDVKVLWNVVGGDITKEISSCVIDCEVVKYDPMESAIQLVERAKLRELNGGRLLPREINKSKRTSAELEQEHKDAQKLGRWKQALKGSKNSKCSNEVRDYLDINFPGWRDEIDFDEKAMEDAKCIVERAKWREMKGGRLLPRLMTDKSKRTSEELEQEHKDAAKLGTWKKALKGKGKYKCSNEVRDYLDINLPGWRDETDFDEKAMEDAKHIVERARLREMKEGRLLPRTIRDTSKRTSEELEQEHKDASKLANWKQALKGQSKGKCSYEVCDYLDNNLPGWRDETDFDEKAIEDAKEIVERAKCRELNGGRLLPRFILEKSKRTSEELEQENKDASKLSHWKQALKGKGQSKCSNKVHDYLDKNLPGWSDELDEKAMEYAKTIVERARLREMKGGRLLPRFILEKSERTNEELEQENRDAVKLGTWKQALKGSKNSKCSDEVREYLDKNLPGWRDEVDFDEKAMEDAKNIVERAKWREMNGGRLLPRFILEKSERTNEELEQEYRDAIKLGLWKKALKGIGRYKCSNEVRDYLDINFPGWRDDFDEKAMEDAKCIVERARSREMNGGRLLPREMNKSKRTNEELEQENRDAVKLGTWKQALKGKGNRSKCSNEVRDYLDINLPGWREVEEEDKKEDIKKDIKEEEEDKEEEFIIFPKKKTNQLYLSKKDKGKDEEKEKKEKQTLSTISELHKKYICANPSVLHKEFESAPKLWHEYHDILEESEKTLEYIPRNKIIEKMSRIQTKRTKLVADMGCGRAKIAKHFANDSRFQFLNYDHVSCDESVNKCDISSLPLENDSVEICILSLAMWGHNSEKYIEEAYRVLETGGKLYIVETTKRWTEKDTDGNFVGELGGKLSSSLEKNNFMILERNIDRFSLFVCVK